MASASPRLAVAMHGEALPVLGATVAAVGLFSWGITHPVRRNALVLMALAAGSGALFFHFDSFWGLFSCGFVLAWSAFGLVPVMDGLWRLKAGFVFAVFLGAIIALWPTAHNFSGGRIPVPRYPRRPHRLRHRAGSRSPRRECASSTR